MDTINTSTKNYFLNRFSTLYDGVLRRIELHYGENGTKQVIVELSTQDVESSSGWSNLVLNFHEVSEFVCNEGQSTRQILSDGVSLNEQLETWWCDFSPYSSECSSINDLRRSDFYVIARGIRWKVIPYSEGC